MFKVQLRGYFRDNAIVACSKPDGQAHAIAVQNAIDGLHVDISSLKRRTKHKLLFYARPEPHAARILFELGALGLIAAIEDGLFDLDQWEFDGIGSVGN